MKSIREKKKVLAIQLNLRAWNHTDWVVFVETIEFARFSVSLRLPLIPSLSIYLFLSFISFFYRSYLLSTLSHLRCYVVQFPHTKLLLIIRFHPICVSIQLLLTTSWPTKVSTLSNMITQFWRWKATVFHNWISIIKRENDDNNVTVFIMLITFSFLALAQR